MNKSEKYYTGSFRESNELFQKISYFRNFPISLNVSNTLKFQEEYTALPRC